MIEFLLMLIIPTIIILAVFFEFIDLKEEREKDKKFDEAFKTTAIAFITPCIAIMITIVLIGIATIVIG